VVIHNHFGDRVMPERVQHQLPHGGKQTRAFRGARAAVDGQKNPSAWGAGHPKKLGPAPILGPR
jgi:hypothetical protein